MYWLIADSTHSRRVMSILIMFPIYHSSGVGCSGLRRAEFSVSPWMHASFLCNMAHFVRHAKH